MAVLIVNIKIDNIPTLLVYEENAKNLPVVFFVHGFTSKKEKDLNIAYELSCRGMACVLIDARHHGERLSSEFANSDDEIKARLFFDIVRETGDDVSRVIDYYSNDERINILRAGVAGISMGGFITYYVICNDKRVKAAVPLIATPDWEGFIDYSRNTIKGIGEDHIKETVKKYDPLNHYKDMHPCALLIQNGKADTLIPYEGSLKLYNLLYPIYNDEDRLKIYLYDNIGHDVIEPMRQRLYDFFLKHL